MPAPISRPSSPNAGLAVATVRLALGARRPARPGGRACGPRWPARACSCATAPRSGCPTPSGSPCPHRPDLGRLARALDQVLPSSDRPSAPAWSTAARSTLLSAFWRKQSVILQPLLDAVLVDLGGTVVVEAPAGHRLSQTSRCSSARGRSTTFGPSPPTSGSAPSPTPRSMVEADVRALLAEVGVDPLLEVLVTSVDAGAAKPDPAAAGDGPAAARARRPVPRALRRRPAHRRRRRRGRRHALRRRGRRHHRAGRQHLGRAGGGQPVRGSPGRGRADRPRRVDRGRIAPGPAHQAARDRSAGSRPRACSSPPSPASPRRRSPSRRSSPCSPPTTGSSASGVSPWPQEVTAQMVANFTAGGAAVNVLARHAGASVERRRRRRRHPAAHRRRRVRGAGSRRAPPIWPIGPAMTRIEALLALDVGAEMAGRAIAGGARCLITGDMGIGNTTPSAALIAAITGRPPVEVTGRGAGADDVVLARKVGGHRGCARAGAEHRRRRSPCCRRSAASRSPRSPASSWRCGRRGARDRRRGDRRGRRAGGRVDLARRPPVPVRRPPLGRAGLAAPPSSTSASSRCSTSTSASARAPAPPWPCSVLQASAKLLREMATFDSAGVTEK